MANSWSRASERQNPAAAMSIRGREQLSGRAFTCRLLDVSNRGAAFVLSREGSVEGLIPGSRVQGIRIENGKRLIMAVPWGVVRYVRVLGRGNGGLGYRIGIEFGNSLDDLATEILRDSGKIQTLIGEAVRRRALRAGPPVGAGGMGPVAGGHLGEGRRLMLPGLHGEVGDVIAVEFDREGSRLRLLAGVAEATPDGVVVRVPDTAERSVRRDVSRRVLAPNRDAFATATSPFGGWLRRRPVIDVTGSGLAIPLDGRNEVLPVGSRVEELRLSFPGGATFTLDGTVRSLVPLPETNAGGYTHRCGIEFGTMPPATRAGLADAVTHAHYPEVEDAAGHSFDDVWRCLEATGFIYPEKAEKLHDVMPELRKTNSALLATPNRIGKTLIFRKSGRVLGHISALRFYSRTFLCQHLAVALHSRNGVNPVRLLNLGLIEYIEQFPEMEWVRVFYRPANRWAQRVFGSLSSRLDHLPTSSVDLLDYFYAPARASAPASAAVGVRPAEAADLDAIERYFVERRPFGLRADDLSKERLELREVEEAYAAIGLMRRREVLIAEQSGRPVAFALIEVSSIGLNFSELTNTFRVFALDDDDDDEGRRALIEHARSRYAALGRNVALALAEPRDRELFESCGFRTTKQYACWSCHRATYRACYDYLARATEPRR